MKTATVREAQHHLSRLLVDVEAGEEIVITRRGVEVAKLVPKDTSTGDTRAKVDWKAFLKGQKEHLSRMPKIEGSAMDADREGYRW